MAKKIWKILIERDWTGKQAGAEMGGGESIGGGRGGREEGRRVYALLNTEVKGWRYWLERLINAAVKIGKKRSSIIIMTIATIVIVTVMLMIRKISKEK